MICQRALPRAWQKKMKATVAPPNTMKTIVTYAFRELEKEIDFKKRRF